MNSLSLVLSLFALVNAASASVKGHGRVIGGTEVNIDQFAFMASVRFNDKHVCGGSIISASTILTAAHCMNSAGQIVISVRVGSTVHSLGDPYKVSSVLVHGDFNPNTMQYDLALIRLLKPLIFGPHVQRIALATKRSLPGTPTVVIGWGMFAAGSSLSEKLRAAVVPIIPSATCGLQYTNVQIAITSQMICATNDNGMVSSCPGDSGGPLVDVSGNLLGVVSFGQGCGNPASGVYASVPDMIEWILSYA